MDGEVRLGQLAAGLYRRLKRKFDGIIQGNLQFCWYLKFNLTSVKSTNTCFDSGLTKKCKDANRDPYSTILPWASFVEHMMDMQLAKVNYLYSCIFLLNKDLLRDVMVNI